MLPGSLISSSGVMLVSRGLEGRKVNWEDVGWGWIVEGAQVWSWDRSS